jgi:aryl-alcohol dehydrogenase-like predicted oxidoreductase
MATPTRTTGVQVSKLCLGAMMFGDSGSEIFADIGDPRRRACEGWATNAALTPG